MTIKDGAKQSPRAKLLAEMCKILLAFVLLFSAPVFSAPPAPQWQLGDFDLPTYGSMGAAKSAYVSSIERYNNEPAYTCHLSDWTWNFKWVNSFTNAAYWSAVAKETSHCIHTNRGDLFTIRASCASGFQTQSDGSCACPAERPEEFDGKCYAPCGPGQFRGAISHTCKNICQPGYYLTKGGSCAPLPPCPSGTSCQRPDESDPEAGPPDCNTGASAGNPINAATGNKFQQELDLTWGPNLRFVRYYNGSGRTAPGFPTGWSHNYAHRIEVVYREIYTPPPPDDVDPDWESNLIGAVMTVDHYMLIRPDGKRYRYSPAGIAEDRTPENIFTMTLTSAGIVVSDGIVTETYVADGRLTTLERVGEYRINVLYDIAGNLQSLVDTRGYRLDFGYDPHRKLLSAAGIGGTAAVNYFRDGSGRLDHIKYVGYGVLSDDSGTRFYHYEDPNPQLLTGVTDEENVRFASWKYDALGRAYESKHAGDVDKVTLSFVEDGSTRYTDQLDALNASRRATFKSFNKRWLLTGNSQPGGAGCSAATSFIGYDNSGNINSRIDFRGILTEYVIDPKRGVETSRTEAKGSLDQRTIATEWHPVFRLPTKITEPGRTTELQYDDKAHVIVRRVTDTSGATSVARTTTYAYVYNTDVNNPYVKKLTVNGPRNDSVVPDEVIYEFDTQGNLATMTRKVGSSQSLVTTYADYDIFGHARRITDPNNQITALFYTPRGWLESRVVGYGTPSSQNTRFEYYRTGLLKKVTLPDNSYVSYAYDGAHRLTDIMDGAGNSIHYTLDGAGNRTDETINDVSGALRAMLGQIDMAQAAAQPAAVGKEM